MKIETIQNWGIRILGSQGNELALKLSFIIVYMNFYIAFQLPRIGYILIWNVRNPKDSSK